MEPNCPPEPNVCLIGAGVAGLAAGAALRRRGIEFDCLEASDDVGGLWHLFGATGPTAAYRSVHTISSRRTIGYRDFPIPEHFPDFPDRERFHDYLRDYAGHFDLRRSIRFGTRVRSAAPLPGGGWRIETAAGESAEYRALVVASGHLTEPLLPDFPGHFDGPVIHARDYVDPTDPVDLHGKRVLVVGLGNSAVDIASELSRKGVADHVLLSARRGAWVVPKYAFGVPFDRLVSLFPSLPLAPQQILGTQLIRLLAGDPARFGLPRPDHRFLQAHPTVSTELYLRLGSGDLHVRPGIAELRGDRVAFADGREDPVDAILCATGYRTALPFFDPGLLAGADGELALYLRIFKPGTPDLAFVGFAEGVPSQPAFDELQADLVAMWLAGEWAPPAPAAMEREIAADRRRFPNYDKEHLVPIYERHLRKRAIPAGRRRVAGGLRGRSATRLATIPGLRSCG